MKAINLDELDKYIKTNKITVYDIFTSGKKSPLYSSRDEQSIDETIEKALETFDSMPSGIYQFKGKPSTGSPNNTWNETDVMVGNAIQQPAQRNNFQSNQRMQGTFTQEDLDKAVAHAKEMQQKDHDLKECKRMYEVLEKKYEKLFLFVQDFEKDFVELLDTLNLEQIRGNNEKGGVTDMVKTAASTAMEHGTKAVIDRFSKYKV